MTVQNVSAKGKVCLHFQVDVSEINCHTDLFAHSKVACHCPFSPDIMENEAYLLFFRNPFMKTSNINMVEYQVMDNTF